MHKLKYYVENVTEIEKYFVYQIFKPKKHFKKLNHKNNLLQNPVVGPHD